MKYRAYVKVTDYDDDFCLFFDHNILDEGEVSRSCLGDTKIQALIRLLDSIQVGHPSFHLGVPIPDSFHHVSAVRYMIGEMLEKCKKGEMPGNLFWGGNWDVTFVVEENVNEATIIPNAVKVIDTISRDGFNWLTIAYDGTYDAYKASPVALEYKGKLYTRMSHNSDTMRISYRTGVPFALKY